MDGLHRRRHAWIVACLATTVVATTALTAQPALSAPATALSAVAVPARAQARPAAAPKPGPNYRTVPTRAPGKRVRTTTPAGSSLVPLAPSSPWLSDISTAPLAPNSAAQTSWLVNEVKNHWGGVAAFNAYEWNLAYYPVAANTRRQDVVFNDCWKYGYTPDGLFNGAGHFKNVPIPVDAIPTIGSDSQITIHDPASDQIWEFWMMRRNSNGRWSACWGGRIDKLSKNIGSFPTYFGTNATSTLGAAGAISIAEAQRGSIRHAMSLQIINPAPWNQFSWPAQRSDGSSNSRSPILEGTRLRLDPRLDLSRYKLHPLALAIAKAAQEYGFIVDNRSGAVAVVAEDGGREQRRTGVNPWKKILGGTEPYNVMRNFPWDKIQALPKDYGKPTR